MASAKEFQTAKIRNVVIVGHTGCGKSSLVDTMAFVSGTTKRRGRTEEGTALTQFRPEEQAHTMSMYCAPAYAEWMKTKINLLDTPGYLDFFGEVEAAVHVADAAVVVVGSKTGVEVGTKQVWDLLEKRALPRILYVSKMDKDGADFEAAWSGIKEELGTSVIPVEIPIGEGDKFRGIINLFSGKAHIYTEGTTKGEYTEQEIPEDMQEVYELWRTELIEAVAETDESLLERYLEGEDISRDEAIVAMASAVKAGDVVPAFCGSAYLTYGMKALLSKIVELLPNPAEAEGLVITKDDELLEMPCDPEGTLAGLVFKTTSEPHVGELSFIRLYSGSIENGAEVFNASTDTIEKLNHLSIPQGKERREVVAVHAGDICVVAKLRNTHTNDSISTKKDHLWVERVPFPVPDTSLAIRGVDIADEDKLGPALARLHEEDPTFHHDFNSEMKETIVSGVGDLHLKVKFEKMKERYNINLTTSAPKIAYRESIKLEAEGQGRHKKQTGGKGQFGDCHLRLKPLPKGEGYTFINSIVGGVIPTKLIPAVDRGVKEAALRGVIAGFPLIDFSAECYYGSYHSVDSSEMAFKLAGVLGFKNAAKKAKPYLLEPVMEVKITVPNEHMGDVSGDVSQRRGRIQGMDTLGSRTTISAVIPQAELHGYAASLRAMTHGRGRHTRTVIGYEDMPPLAAEKVIEAYNASK